MFLTCDVTWLFFCSAVCFRSQIFHHEFRTGFGEIEKIRWVGHEERITDQFRSSGESSWFKLRKPITLALLHFEIPLYVFVVFVFLLVPHILFQMFTVSFYFFFVFCHSATEQTKVFPTYTMRSWGAIYYQWMWKRGNFSLKTNFSTTDMKDFRFVCLTRPHIALHANKANWARRQTSTVISHV